MPTCFRLMIGILLWSVSAYAASAEENVVLDNYTCAEFLNDVKEPADGARLLRSLMMIGWAGGYAAAHQQGPPRADPAAIQLIAATLGDACRKAPDHKVVHAIADAIARFAKTEPPAAPGSPSADAGVAAFVTYDSYDIYGGDFRRTEQIDLKECVAACQAESQCKGYSYDKWNRVCFLKEQLSALNLEPNSVSGVRGPNQLKRSTSGITTDRRRNRDFTGKILAERPSPDFDSCQRLCSTEKDCISFSFIRSRKKCKLYSSADSYRVQNGIDSGIKRQIP